MQQILAILSSIIALISPVIYSRAILKGEAKPHRTTRLILLLITALTFASLIAQHNTVAIWLSGASFLQSIVVFILSLKHGMGGWGKMDVLCLIIALAGIVAWKTSSDPVLALYFAIAADFTGMIPALIKTFKWPETEVWTFYILDSIAAACNLLALQNWDISDYSYPVYILVINMVMVGLIFRPWFNKVYIRREP